ncbi:MAG: hypothetical protein MUO76_17865 [Anaerolineaceae bacterium]|nr:hypothetical protein [Anaerolineaceae bacterium]
MKFINPRLLKIFLLLISTAALTAAIIQCCLIGELESEFIGYGITAAVILVGVAVFCTWLTARSIMLPGWMDAAVNSLEHWILSPHRLLSLIIILTFFLLAGIGGIILFSLRSAKYFGAWTNIFGQVNMLVFFIVGSTFLILIFLALSFSRVYSSPGFIHFPTIGNTLLVLAILTGTILHWAVLYYQVRLFKMIPGWFWGFHDKYFHANDWLFLLIFLISITIVAFILRNQKNYKRNLFLLVLLGYFLQIVFGFIEGQGFEDIRLKFAASTHKGYAEHASDRPDILDALLNYEQKYGWDNYLGTKPPGVLLIYTGLQKVSNFYKPEESFDGRFLRLTGVISYVFPLISMLVLIVLYHFSRRLSGEKDAILPSILYIFCPNVILIPLFLDQVFYPLFLVIGLFLVLLVIQRQSVGLAFAAGIYMYLALYFTFSMIPLIAAGFLWIMSDYFVRRESRSFWHVFKILAALTIGILLLFIIFRYYLNYDILVRYQTAFEHHMRLKLNEPGFKNFLLNILLNNVELFSWTGFIMIFLVIARAIKSLIAFFRHQADQADILLLTTLIMYFALNLFSQTRGEVGRIWLFMVPAVALFASIELKDLFRNKHIGVVTVVFIQLITTILTFEFQDFLT